MPPAKFILDVHLGKLASHLRMFGYDALYCNTFGDADLVRIAQEEGRILLSKDQNLQRDLPSKSVYLVVANDPRLQLIEVMRRFRLFDSINPFSRCLLCNDPLVPVDKEVVLDRLPEKVREVHREFYCCPRCDRVYWKGDHYERMSAFIDGIMQERI